MLYNRFVSTHQKENWIRKKFFYIFLTILSWNKVNRVCFLRIVRLLSLLTYKTEFRFFWKHCTSIYSYYYYYYKNIKSWFDVINWKDGFSFSAFIATNTKIILIWLYVDYLALAIMCPNLLFSKKPLYTRLFY